MNEQKKRPQDKTTETDRNKQGTCPQCSKSFPQYRKGRLGWYKKQTFEMSIDCFRSQGQQKPAENSSASGIQ